MSYRNYSWHGDRPTTPETRCAECGERCAPNYRGQEWGEWRDGSGTLRPVHKWCFESWAEKQPPPAPSSTGEAAKRWDDVGGRPVNPDPLAQWAEPGAAAGATEKNPMEPKRTRRELHDTGAAADAWDRLDYLRQRYAADPVVLGILASVAALRSEVARLRSSPVSAADGALREASRNLLDVLDAWAWTNHHIAGRSPDEKATVALDDFNKHRDRVRAALSRVPSSVAASEP